MTVDTATWLAIASLVTNVITVAVAARALRNEREKTAAEHRKAEALEQLAKSQAVIAGSLEKDLASLRKELEAVKSQVHGAGRLADLKAQELEDKRRQAEWKKSKEIAKGLGWVLENL